MRGWPACQPTMSCLSMRWKTMLRRPQQKPRETKQNRCNDLLTLQLQQFQAQAAAFCSSISRRNDFGAARRPVCGSFSGFSCRAGPVAFSRHSRPHTAEINAANGGDLRGHTVGNAGARPSVQQPRRCTFLRAFACWRRYLGVLLARQEGSHRKFALDSCQTIEHFDVHSEARRWHHGSPNVGDWQGTLCGGRAQCAISSARRTVWPCWAVMAWIRCSPMSVSSCVYTDVLGHGDLGASGPGYGNHVVLRSATEIVVLCGSPVPFAVMSCTTLQ